MMEIGPCQLQGRNFRSHANNLHSQGHRKPALRVAALGNVPLDSPGAPSSDGGSVLLERCSHTWQKGPFWNLLVLIANSFSKATPG